MPPRPGRSSARRQSSRPINSLKEITLPTRTNASLSTAAGANAAPTATPITAGGAHARTTSIITAPLSRCVRNESTFVGTMIAIDVPTQSWKRTSSGTSSARKTSYKTGTMSAPPPMPKRPAKMPVMKPPTMIRAASSSSSLAGTPKIMSLLRKGHGPKDWRESSGGGVRDWRVHVHHEGERIAEGASARARFHRLGCKVAAERTRAWDASEQAEHVPGHGVKARAAHELPFEIGDQRLGRRSRRRIAGGRTVQQGIDVEQTPRLLIGGATHHDAVEALKMTRGLIEIDNAAVEHDGETAVRRLEP